MSTVADCLARARALGVDRLDAQLLLARRLGQPRSWLMAHDDAVLSPSDVAGFDAELARRATGEPLAYIVGEKEFHGLMLRVDARVLVPRPDTETLVAWALEVVGTCDVADVLDLGTGSGAIALALKQARPALQVSASDHSTDALALAEGNGRRLGLQVTWLPGDWWRAVPANARFGLVVGNPPYIAEGDVHLAALAHEPISALTSGADGLDALRRIVDGASAHLGDGAWLLLEHGHEQAAAVRGLLGDHGFVGVQSRRDLSGVERCSGGRRPPA